MPDIDIDFGDRNELLNKLQHRVSVLQNGKKHNTGIYVTEIPHNPITNISTIDYKTAEERGYFKLDFLNVSLYKEIKNEEHLNKLMNTEPVWELLEHQEIVDQLFHVSGHADILKKLKPNSIEQLAACLAIIRPAKRHLINSDWKTIMQEVWKKPDDEKYFFKHSHAISYAFVVVVNLNLLTENL